MSEPFRQSLDDAGRAALRAVAPEVIVEFRGEHNRKLSTAPIKGDSLIAPPAVGPSNFGRSSLRR